MRQLSDERMTAAQQDRNIHRCDLRHSRVSFLLGERFLTGRQVLWDHPGCMSETPPTPLASVRIVECSMLGPGALTTTLADLGADVIKVEPPSGDYLRETTWPIVEGTSLMHLHINRGNRSVVLDLRNDGGRAVFLDLVRGADAVIEAMRPGGLERRGVGYEACRAVNPRDRKSTRLNSSH